MRKTSVTQMAEPALQRILRLVPSCYKFLKTGLRDYRKFLGHNSYLFQKSISFCYSVGEAHAPPDHYCKTHKYEVLCSSSMALYTPGKTLVNQLSKCWMPYLLWPIGISPTIQSFTLPKVFSKASLTVSLYLLVM